MTYDFKLDEPPAMLDSDTSGQCSLIELVTRLYAFPEVFVVYTSPIRVDVPDNG